MPDEVLGLVVRTTEVVHPSGAPSTAVWLSDGRSMLAYSGDTQWTGALITAADGADLFIIECYDYDRDLTGHMSFATIKTKLPAFRAKRIMLTHMNPTMLARQDEARAAGLMVAHDGLAVEI